MIIFPEQEILMHKNDTLEELMKERQNALKGLAELEKETLKFRKLSKEDQFKINSQLSEHSDPEFYYCLRLRYLNELHKLILNKIDEDYRDTNEKATNDEQV